MKVCKTCGIEKHFDDFHLKSDAPDNRHPHCKECSLARHRAYYQKNKQAAKDRANEWRRDNPEARAKIQSKYAKANPEKVNAKFARYRARKMKATPTWFCDITVSAIYDGCPEGYEVDHIVPLHKGGLHSHENLQYLTVEENRTKADKDY